MALILSATGADGALVEPSEAEMRAAYIDDFQKSMSAQGRLANPGCNLAVKGCSVVLLDMRRDYRLIGFKKKKCHPVEPTGFACAFQANVSCAYSAGGKANPYVTDIYCGPLTNKTSSFIAIFTFVQRAWVIDRFVQG